MNLGRKRMIEAALRDVWRYKGGISILFVVIFLSGPNVDGALALAGWFLALALETYVLVDRKDRADG